MDDKEVGALWEWHRDKTATGFNSDIIVALIRKLVNGRITFYMQANGFPHYLAVPIALRDFNIDPSTWGSK